MKHIKIISDFCPGVRILVCDELGFNHLQKDCSRRKIFPVVRVVIVVYGVLFFAHYYLWGAWIDSKFCSHDVIIELGHHFLDNYFGVQILTLMNILDILDFHEILWVQEKSKPVVVFC